MDACATCRKNFDPGMPKLKAMGKIFHKGCFVCKDCKQSIVDMVRQCRDSTKYLKK